jgi:GTP diphosphokinase / guanosine-3',5'-bis(diphosphate) 3'-diphosphatase
MIIDVELEKNEILKRYRKLLLLAKKSRDDLDKKQIRKAFNVALEAHKEMRRKSGEPYIYHPIAVAQIVAEEMGLGTTSIVSALLHDTVEDTEITLEDIDNMFGPKVCLIIDGLTKISGIIDHSDPNYSIQAENFRKMMLSLSEDVRVILVKLADRLHNMRTMEFMPRHKQLKISYETLFIYAPLAYRLGLNAIKTELENLAFQYTETELHNEIINKLKEGQRKLTRYINKFSLPIINSLMDKGYDFEVSGRPKSPYSIAQKMKSQNIPFEEVYDIFAFRIILNSTPENEKSECWNAYSLITDMYTPRPDRLRDWISNPKANGYESLHTTVMGPEGKWVEVQIRTKKMHDIAEKGLAAHWKYKSKDGSNSDNRVDEWIEKIRKLLESPHNQAIDFIDDVKLNLFSDEIFVFTPVGEIIKLPIGATALDFAYEIHSRIGDACIGAKVNHKLVPLNYKIKSGEQLEVLTSKKQVPKQEWLKIVTTAKAKHGIKNGVKRDRKIIATDGKEKYNRIMKGIPEASPELLPELISHFGTSDAVELFVKIAEHKIEKGAIKNYISQRNKHQKAAEDALLKQVVKSKAKGDGVTAKSFKKEDVLVLGEDKDIFDYKISPCCNPIPGDEVFGFVTVVDGIKIHKTNCPNAMHLQANFAYRTIKAVWEDKSKNEFLTGVRFTGTDDFGLVSKIVTLISGESKLRIKSIKFDSDHGVFEGKVMLFVQDTKELLDLSNKLKEIKGVHNIKRIHTN